MDKCEIQVMGYIKTVKASTGQHVFNNLYVKNFPNPAFEEGDLYDIFSKYGVISSVALMRDENNKSKGFGFVCF